MARIGNLIRDPVELKSRSVQLEQLAVMPERVTKDDLQKAAQAMRDCSDDITYLLRGELVGCPCRRIENDNTGASYLVYVDECPHHRWLKREEERLKAAYADAEKKLADGVRLQFFKSALEGILAGRNSPGIPEWTIEEARKLADQAVAALLK
jgi:hypothetical protein